MKIGLKSENSFLFYALISLACLNFTGRGSIIFFIFALLTFIRTGHIQFKLNAQFFFAFLLSIAGFVVVAIHSPLYLAIKPLNYVLLYVIGNNCYRFAENRSCFVKRVFFAGFLGFDAYIILTYFYNLNKTFEYGRRIYNVWTGDFIAVTLIGLLSSVVIGYSFYAIFLQPKKLLKLFGFASVIIMFMVNAQTATRTPIIMFLVIYSVMGLIYLFARNRGNAIRVVIVAGVLIGMLVLLYNHDVMGLKTYILSTAAYERFMMEGLESSRFDISAYYLRHMLDYPWGGGEIHALHGTAAHFFILDGHDKYGIFATVALVGLGIGFVVNIVKLVTIRSKTSLDYLFISMYLSMVIQICLEPVFDGYPVLLMYLILIHGIAAPYIAERKMND